MTLNQIEMLRGCNINHPEFEQYIKCLETFISHLKWHSSNNNYDFELITDNLKELEIKIDKIYNDWIDTDSIELEVNFKN